MTTTTLTTTMLDVRTTRFGELETVAVAEEAVLTFPDGLPGFERQTTFALVEHERIEPFLWLQSLRDPSIGFLVIEPALLVDDYSFDLNDADAALLGLTDDAAPPRVLAVLVVPDDVRAMTANLQAPLVINEAGRIGKQVILTDEHFSMRHPVLGERGGHVGDRRHGETKHAARRRAC